MYVYYETNVRNKWRVSYLDKISVLSSYRNSTNPVYLVIVQI